MVELAAVEEFRQRMILVKFMQAALANAEVAVWCNALNDLRDTCADLRKYLDDLDDWLEEED